MTTTTATAHLSAKPSLFAPARLRRAARAAAALVLAFHGASWAVAGFVMSGFALAAAFSPSALSFTGLPSGWALALLAGAALFMQAEAALHALAAVRIGRPGCLRVVLMALALPAVLVVTPLCIACAHGKGAEAAVGLLPGVAAVAFVAWVAARCSRGGRPS